MEKYKKIVYNNIIVKKYGGFSNERRFGIFD